MISQLRVSWRLAMVAGLLVAGGLVSAVAAAPRSAVAKGSGAAYVADEVIVQFQPGTLRSERASARQQVGATSSEPLSPLATDAEVFKLGNGATVEGAIEGLRRNPNVVFAEPNYLVEAEPSFVSDDPKFTNGTLWGMLGDSSTPANAYGSQAAEAWAAGHVGSRNVYVVVIDEGFQTTHPDLAANAWTNPHETLGDGTDNDGNGYIDDIHGWDFYSNDNSVYDGTGDDHGTHVAGTIGGVGGNGLGVAGVNWNVTMISAKFLGPSGGSTADAVRAVDYATDLKIRHGLNIVATSNSWGGGGFSQSLLDAIERGGDRGILFVAAAGNSNTNNDSAPHYPSNYSCDRTATGATRGWDCVISVASITNTGARSSFSNYGTTSVDLGAPGSAIDSTLPPDTYGTYSGTSMATPHVSGALALCASIDPSQTAFMLRAALLDGAQPTTSLAGITTTGGRLDISGMLSSCAPVTAPVSGAPSNLAATASGPTRVALSWTDGSTNEKYHEIQISS
ncbi:MAG TPA: S8 family peptidase, partial [Ilumatobacter sp.]